MTLHLLRRIVFCAFFPAMVLAGCAGGPYDDGYGDKGAVGKKSGKGLVVFRMRGNDLKRVPVRLYWRAFHKQGKQPVSPQRWLEMKHKGNALPRRFARNSNRYDRYQIKVAKAGHYYLDNMRVREPNDSGPKKVRGRTVYFTVRPGQAVYVGDFKIDHDDQNPEYQLIDDFARAKRFMSKRRDIRRPLRRGLAQRIQIETADGD
ncbi:MAG: hypothetical protein OEU46_18615 [Alphaproteobacteria bacterium]|nr:hypothetical protein [Alphaproteobacteria bacterium]